MANRYSLDATFNLIDKATKPLEKIAGGTNKVGNAVKASFTKAQKRVDEFGKKLGKLPGYFNKAALAAAGATAAAASTFVVQGVKGAIEFEKSMEKVGARANLSKDQITAFSDQLIKLSNQTGTALSTLTEAQLHAISNGVNVADSVQFLEVAVKAATGGFTDTTKVIDSLTSVLKSYGLEANAAGKISDQMMAAAKAGGVSFEDMSTKLERVIPVAAKFGVTSDELFASIAALTSRGVPVADAAKKIKQALEKDGKQGLFNTMQGEKFNEILHQIKHSVGATEDAFLRVDKTIGMQWGSVINKIKNSGIKLGTSLLPAFQKIIDKVSLFIDKFSEFDFGPFVAQAEAALDKIFNSINFDTLVEDIGNFFSSVMKIADCIINFIKLIWDLRIPIILLVGTITICNGVMSIAAAVQWALNAAMTANPIGLVIAAVVALIAIIILLVKNWDKVVAAFKKAFKAIGNFFIKIWEGIKSFFGKVVEFVKKNALNILNVILTILFFPAGVIMAVVRLIIKHWDKIKEALGKVGEFIKGAFNKVKEGVSKVWGGIKEGASKAWEGIKGGVSKLKDNAVENFNKVKERAGVAFNKVLDVAEWGLGKIENRFPGIADTGREVLGALRQAASGDFSGIKDLGAKMIDKLKTGFSDFKDTASEKLGAISDFFSGIFNKIKEAFQNVIDFFKEGIEKIKGFFSGIADAVGGFFGGVGDFFTGKNKKTDIAPQVNNIVPPAVTQTTTQTAGIAANVPSYRSVNNRNNQTISAAATPATRPMTTAEQHIYRETTNREQVDIAVRAEQGTRARVTRPTRSPNVMVAASGGNR